MTRFNCIRLLHLVLILGFSVATTHAQESNRFTLSGQFPKFKQTNYQIMFDYDPSNLLNSLTVATGETDEQGRFKVDFEVGDGQAFVLLMDRSIYRLWCEPNSELSIEELEDNQVVCRGKLGAENQYLLDSGLAVTTPMNSDAEFQAERFTEIVDQVSQDQSKRLEALVGATEVSDRFQLYARAQIIGTATYKKNMGPRLLIRQGKLSKDELPEDFYQFLESIPLLEDAAALTSRSYQNALQAAFQYRAEQELIAEGIDPSKDLGKWTRKELAIQARILESQPATNELLYANKIGFMIQYMQRQDTMRALDDFTNRFPASSHGSRLTDSFAKSQKIDLQAIDAACKFVNGKGNRVSFSNLKGKVVYVDFWGLWCKACMTLQPDLEKLIEEFSDDERIVFLSINFSDSHEDWKEHIDRHSGRGIHWKPATSADEEVAMEQFLLSSFPRFMIFGKDGELVTASAQVPGSGKAVGQLEAALQSNDEGK